MSKRTIPAEQIALRIRHFRDEKGLGMSKDQSREIVYGMPYDEWRKKFQKEASAEQKAAFEKSSPRHS